MLLCVYRLRWRVPAMKPAALSADRAPIDKKSPDLHDRSACIARTSYRLSVLPLPATTPPFTVKASCRLLDGRHAAGRSSGSDIHALFRLPGFEPSGREAMLPMKRARPYGGRTARVLHPIPYSRAGLAAARTSGVDEVVIKGSKGTPLTCSVPRTPRSVKPAGPGLRQVRTLIRSPFRTSPRVSGQKTCHNR